MPTPCLNEFTTTVPVCWVTMTIAAILDRFSQNRCDRLVVVSEQQHPLGLLHLNRLLPYLIVDKQQGEQKKETQSLIPQPSQNLQQSLSDLDLSLLEPLATLSADLTWKQFQLELKTNLNHPNTPQEWAIVDQNGKFLGLLDSQRLLYFVATQSPTAIAESDPLQPQEPPPPDDRDGLPLLIKLLEQLPLPLMLQTSAGQPVTQNLAWRQHLGSLAQTDLLTREAAILLESAPSQAETPFLANCLGLENPTNSSFSQNYFSTCRWKSYPAAIPNQTVQTSPTIFSSPADNPTTLKKPNNKDKKKQKRPNIVSDRLPIEPNTLPTLDNSESAALKENWIPAPSASFCQAGANPNTCICSYPIPNESERVWQLVKIPLGSVLSGLELASAETNDTSQSIQETLSLQPFRLAHFGLNTELTEREQLVESTDLWLVFAQDVTEQQQVAKELSAKNADLVQLNRLKDEFLACISHELKTPLTSVLGLSSLLKDQLLGELNERQCRYVRLIHQSGRHLMAIVNDILDLTRIETGQLELSLGLVTIQAVCERAYQQARQQHLMTEETEPEDLKVSPEPQFNLEIESGLETLIADELRLRQMLVNLLSNALKFTEVTGSIGLRVSRWEGWIAFTVWDTGIGIPDQKQHLIFQKFQQLESPLTRQYQGTGLGLVLTQRLAHLHGGDVSFMSKENQGSHFTLLLPPKPPQQEADKQRSQEEIQEYLSRREFTQPEVASLFPCTHSRLVLIVEATSRFIENLTEQLTGLGYRVVIARSGTEALTKARALQPGVIFLNPLLPLLSGWDVLTLLKSTEQTRHIPVIVMTTRAEKKQVHLNRADDFLCLPVELEALQQSLDRVTRSTTMEAEEEANLDTRLTILHLSKADKSKPGNSFNSAEVEQDNDSVSGWTMHHEELLPSPLSKNLSGLLHRHRCRVLEADDLEQAELLAKIWQPHVVLLERDIPNPLAYLQQLSQYSALARLPLVTLDPATTQAANQVKELSVFPCLEPPGSLNEVNALLQAIQVAARIVWKSSILVVDLSTLPDLCPSAELVEPGLGSFEPVTACNPASLMLGNAESNKKRIEWLRALIKYLETAGYKGVTAHSWPEVLRQIQHRSIDLLLIDLGDFPIAPGVMKALYSLRHFGDRPPILVLERRTPSNEAITEDSPQKKGQFVKTGVKPVVMQAPVLQEIATQILPMSLSMEELLNRIRQALGQSVQPSGMS